MNNIPLDKIEKMLDAYVERVYNGKFVYRPQQKEAILDILNAFFDGNCNLYLLEGPVGSGKSFIAMIVAGFLSECKLKGYILASDLMLQTQYERDFKRNKLEWGSIKGVDNYECVVNYEKFSLGDCKLKNVSYEAAEELGCFKDCGYLFNRKKAIKSPVSLLNYSYHTIQMNYVMDKMQDKGRTAPFAKRDFTICDEAHKLAEIIQNHFSPCIDDRAIEKLEKIRLIAQKYNLEAPKTTSLRLRTVIRSMFTEEHNDRIYSLLKEFELQLIDFIKTGAKIREYVTEQYKGIEIPKEWRYNIGLLDWLKDMHCKFEDYNHIITQAGIKTLVKNPSIEQITFNCLDESYMMNRHFHEKCGFKLLMSATLGDPASFLKTIGATDARYFKMDSHFDFSKSPIMFYPNKKMSLSYKDSTMPWLSKKIDEILFSHHNESGIIHSGSYDIASKIFLALSDENKKRVLVYSNSQEKEIMLEKFLKEKNKVLIGPSLLEGLDLSSEKSRFQIFAKVPYPSIGDRFVKAKMNYQPSWYAWKTCNSVVQGMGRSIRTPDDWAVSYMLDGCFKDLLKNSRSNFPIEFQRRIKVVNE